MKTKIAILIAMIAVVAVATARTRTTQTQLKNNSQVIEEIPTGTIPDSLLTEVEPNAVTLK